MDVDRAVAVIRSATLEVFETMLGSRLEARPAVDDGATGRCFSGGGVTALLPFDGSITGWVCVHSRREQALEFTARMLGGEPGEVSWPEDVCDAMGEIANMIAGGVKRELAGSEPIEIALPSVTTEPGEPFAGGGRLRVLVPFLDEAGVFHVGLIAGAPA